MQSTIELLNRVQSGDEAALNQLLQRVAPDLRRWAHNRLPRDARGLMETDDLVQDVLVRSIANLGEFEPRREGALLAYFRQAVLNRVRDEARRARRRPAEETLDQGLAETAPSPLEDMLQAEQIEIYETALSRLKPEEREAVIARVEMGKTHEEIAELLEKPSPDAARMFAARAILKLAREMNRLAGRPR